jgi:hypothetical protein
MTFYSNLKLMALALQLVWSTLLAVMRQQGMASGHIPVQATKAHQVQLWDL